MYVPAIYRQEPHTTFLVSIDILCRRRKHFLHTEESVFKRPRGRPLGSKNKPKPVGYNSAVNNEGSGVKRLCGRPQGSITKPKLKPVGDNSAVKNEGSSVKRPRGRPPKPFTGNLGGRPRGRLTPLPSFLTAESTPMGFGFGFLIDPCGRPLGCLTPLPSFLTAKLSPTDFRLLFDPSGRPRGLVRAKEEIGDHNASGSYVIMELWNYEENRKVTLEEATNVMLKVWSDLGGKKNKRQTL
ncbi:unnamed protein product [Microthlaspi erraticum]|uniref:Factor of DNA methylation 1-5/IDN2 domain-containing protein n=1 Tax=Microthlaspi erraticum TaxID=1685480 RepID=A0A6D2JDR4_9BRAS|nr:unnamed protein product [Microthlaspi erraticum]